MYVHFSHGFTKDDDICYRPHVDDRPECDFIKDRLVCFNGLNDEWRAR